LKLSTKPVKHILSFPTPQGMDFKKSFSNEIHVENPYLVSLNLLLFYPSFGLGRLNSIHIF
jgi:hypothetical protein